MVGLLQRLEWLVHQSCGPWIRWVRAARFSLCARGWDSRILLILFPVLPSQTLGWPELPRPCPGSGQQQQCQPQGRLRQRAGGWGRELWRAGQGEEPRLVGSVFASTALCDPGDLSPSLPKGTGQYCLCQNCGEEFSNRCRRPTASGCQNVSVQC